MSARQRLDRSAPRGIGWLVALGLGLAPGPVAADSAPVCSAARSPELQRICDRGELVVARYGGERPPFFFRQGGEWVGFDVDLGRDVARVLGVAYREDTSAESFDSVVDKVASGEADIAISKLSSTLERALAVRFTDPYLTVYQAVVVNRVAVPRGGDPFRRLDAAGTAVGALAGSAYVGYANELFAAAEVRPYDDLDTMLGDVVAGRLAAALLDSANADTWRRAHRQQLIQVRTRVDKTRKDPLAMAVAWQDLHLAAWLDLYLTRIRDDGTAERLYRKWFGAGEGEAEGP